MKKLLVILIAFTIILGSCTNSPNMSSEINESFSQSETNTKKGSELNNKLNSESSADSADYDIETKTIQLSMEQYANTPYINGNEIIASNPDNWMLSATAKTVVYDIDAEKEKELDFISVDPKLDSNYYYYTNLGDTINNQTSIMKERKSTGQREAIYTVSKSNQRISVKLNLVDNYIGFYEEIYSENLENVVAYRMVIIDTEGTVMLNDTAIPFGPFDTVKICKGGKVILCQKNSNNKFKLMLYDFKSKEILLSLEISDIPISCDYDGNLLGWSLNSGKMSIVNVSTGDKEDIDNDCGDIRILDSRYIIYGKDLDIFVYDLVDKKIIFQASRDAEKEVQSKNENTLHFISFFQIDKENKTVLVQYEDWTVGYFNIMLMKFVPQ